MSTAAHTLPHNLEAERAVLGCILVNNAALSVASAWVGPGDFYRDDHRRIFTAMLALAAKSFPIDFLTTKEILGDQLDVCGGPGYIAGLTDGMPTSANVEHSARIIKEKARLREVIFHGNRMTAAAYAEDGSAAEIAAGASQSLSRAVQPAVPRGREGLAVPAWPDKLGPALSGPFGELVQAIAPHTEADPAAILLHALVMFGNCLGRTAHFCVEATQHYGVLFGVVVAASGKGRKGVSRRRAERIFEHADPEWQRGRILTGLSSGEGLLWAVRDATTKRDPETQTDVIDDPGIEDKRACVVEEEFAKCLTVGGREGNTLSETLRTLWDCPTTSGTLTKSKGIRATGAHVSVIGHITSAELVRKVTATDQLNGFCNRIGWCLARRSNVLPDGGGDVDLAPFAWRVASAVRYGRTVGELKRTPAASAAWHRIYADLSDKRPGMAGSVVSRGEAMVMRLALLYAVADESDRIGLPHLRAGLDFWRYLYQSAYLLFGDSVGDKTADDLLHALRAAGPEGLIRSEIGRDVCSGNKSGRDILQALRLLESYGLARCHVEASGGGRPPERWVAAEGIVASAGDYGEMTRLLALTEGDDPDARGRVTAEDPTRETRKVHERLSGSPAAFDLSRNGGPEPETFNLSRNGDGRPFVFDHDPGTATPAVAVASEVVEEVEI